MTRDANGIGTAAALTFGSALASAALGARQAAQERADAQATGETMDQWRLALGRLRAMVDRYTERHAADRRRIEDLQTELLVAQAELVTARWNGRRLA